MSSETSRASQLASPTSPRQAATLEGFLRVAQFSVAPGDSIGGIDIIAWKGGFAALGGPGIWTSGSGREWDAVEPSGLDDVIINRLLATADGALVAIGKTLPTHAGGPFGHGAWRSANATNWTLIDLGFSPDFALHDVASGPRGMVMAADEVIGGQTHAVLLQSTDGFTWTRTFDQQGDLMIAAIGAGPQGFVAVGQHGWATNEGRGFVLASSDGLHWIEAASEAGVLRDVSSLWDIAPMGGDWVATPNPTARHADVLLSDDGLNWRTAATIPLGCYLEALTTADLAGDGSRVLLHVGVAGDCPPESPSLWVSTDAQTWRPMETNVLRGAIAMAAQEGTTVLMAVLADGASSRVEFWIGDSLPAP